jgi:preprotein translocase subunit SecA
MQEQHASASATQSMARASQAPEPQARTVVRDAPKVGRNDPCPCGSGLKYKKCCGVSA